MRDYGLDEDDDDHWVQESNIDQVFEDFYELGKELGKYVSPTLSCTIMPVNSIWCIMKF